MAVKSLKLFTTLVSSINTQIEENIPVTNIIPALKEISEKYYKMYSGLEYNAFECKDMTILEETNILSIYYVYKLMNYNMLFKQFGNDLYSVLKLTPNETGTNETERTGTNQRNESENNSSNNNSYAMSENAPINADINTINTPNSKSKATSDNTVSNALDRTDTLNSTDTNIFDKSNPYYYEVYNRLLKEYNIDEIVNNCFKCILHEYAD